MSPQLSLLLAQIGARIILDMLNKDEDKATPEVRSELVELLEGLFK